MMLTTIVVLLYGWDVLFSTYTDETPVVKSRKNSIFLKNGKTVISIGNRKFSRSRMTKWTSPLNSSREI